MSGLVNHVPTTNAGESAYIFDEEIQYGGTFVNIKMYGHVLLNQRGTLLIQNRYQVRGISLNKFFLQRICVTIFGISIPLLYLEGVLFPSIYWKISFDGCFIVGCIPAPLLTESIISLGFVTIQSHFQSILTNPSSITSAYPQYCAHCYEMLTNISSNHEDTWLILNRGLTVADYKFGGLRVKVKGYSALLEFLDNK